MNGQIAESRIISRMTIVLYDCISAHNKQNMKKMVYECYKQQSNLIHNAEEQMKFNFTVLLNSLCNYCFVEDSSLILSLIYLDRILLTRKLCLSYEVLQTLLLGCVIAAVKYNQDYHNLKIVHLITGIHLDQVAIIECWILEALSYCLYVNDSIYEIYSFHLTSFKIPLIQPDSSKLAIIART